MVELKYFDPNKDSEENYIELLKCHYGNHAIQRYKERGEWYKHVGYKILLAYLDGKMSGQNTAFLNIAVVHGKDTKIWWGADSFVVNELRGKGIGKQMQKMLHADLPNFSSAWYSPANGHIKIKCGASELFKFKFYYYPISSLCNLFINKAKNKLHGLRLLPKIARIYVYLNISHNKEYIIKESTLNEDTVSFINDSLQRYDFYIKRDWNYLKWRYQENPNLKYKVYKIYKKKELVAIQICSDIVNIDGFKFIYSLDTFIKDDLIQYKNILSLISNHFCKNKQEIDGVMSLQECKWLGRFSFNKKEVPFLTTLIPNKRITNPYISYSDQDMVQMY